MHTQKAKCWLSKCWISHLAKDNSTYWQFFVCLFCLCSAHTKSWILLVQMLKISKHLVKDVSAYWRLFVCLFCLCSAHTKSRELFVQMLNKNFKTFGKRRFGFLTTFFIHFLGGGGCVKASPSTALPLSKITNSLFQETTL